LALALACLIGCCASSATVLLSAIFLRVEPLPARAIGGILISVAAIVYLVAG